MSEKSVFQTLRLDRALGAPRPGQLQLDWPVVAKAMLLISRALRSPVTPPSPARLIFGAFHSHALGDHGRVTPRAGRKKQNGGCTGAVGREVR